MATLSRRGFLKATGGMAAVGAAGIGFPQLALGGEKRVVVVGGGAAGAVAAKSLKAADPDLKVTLIEAEARTLAFLEQHVAPNASPLCGNSIWQDRRFLARHMPTLENYLHYRLIDVSTIKELARRWHPTAYTTFTKRNPHRALGDIRESIAELAHYRRSFLQTPSSLKG